MCLSFNSQQRPPLSLVSLPVVRVPIRRSYQGTRRFLLHCSGPLDPSWLYMHDKRVKYFLYRLQVSVCRTSHSATVLHVQQLCQGPPFYVVSNLTSLPISRLTQLFYHALMESVVSTEADGLECWRGSASLLSSLAGGEGGGGGGESIEGCFVLRWKGLYHQPSKGLLSGGFLPIPASGI